MVKNYVGALKKGNTGAIMGLVLLLVLVWFLYKYFTKKQEGYSSSSQGYGIGRGTISNHSPPSRGNDRKLSGGKVRGFGKGTGTTNF
jgi:hypothetical protein